MKLAVVAALVIAAPAVAVADEWSHTQEFQNAQTASIRVVEPENYKVTVNGRTDTTPAVFAVDNADNYLVVRFEAPSGASWERKIEVKAYRQTVLRVKHVAAKADAPKDAPKGRSFIGVVANTTHLCKASKERVQIRLDFVNDSGVVKSVTLDTRSRKDVELPAGAYAVRRFKPFKGEWAFDGAENRTIDKDGWTYHYGCEP